MKANGINANNKYSKESVPIPDAETTCWWQMTRGAMRLKPAPCYVSSRYNSKGHLVFDVVEKNGGYERVIVLWEGRKAEVILMGKVYTGVWDIDSEKDIWVRVAGGSFAFRLPREVIRTARPRTPTSRARRCWDCDLHRRYFFCESERLGG